MYNTLRKLKGSMIVSSDEANIGEIKDFFFDDEKWIIRYFVVNTGGWLNQRLVLISPCSVRKIDREGFNININMTRAQIEGAPTPEDERPVSRLYEEKYSRYYQLPFYWTAGDSQWPNNIYTPIYADSVGNRDYIEKEIEKLNEKIAVNHLRSYDEVMGYRMHANEDVFGHVEDMVIDLETYKVEYLIIDTKNFLPSPSVLVPVDWITDIDWQEKELHTMYGWEKILSARHYHYDRPIDMDLR